MTRPRIAAATMTALATLAASAPALAMGRCPSGEVAQNGLALGIVLLTLLTAIVSLVVGIRRGVAANGGARVGWIALGIVAALVFLATGSFAMLKLVVACLPF